MANCGLTLNDGSSFFLLNDGTSAILLNDATCAFEPGQSVLPDGGRRGYAGGHYSRKKWRELQEELYQEARVAAQAQSIKDEKDRLALVEASIAAQEVAFAEAEAASLVKVRDLMRLANRAKTAHMRQQLSMRIVELAREIKVRIEEERDEEEAIELLLSRGWL
jgi:hypothetical protein